MTAATHSEFSIKSNFCLKDIPTSPGLCFDEEKVHNTMNTKNTPHKWHLLVYFISKHVAIIVVTIKLFPLINFLLSQLKYLMRLTYTLLVISLHKINMLVSFSAPLNTRPSVRSSERQRIFLQRRWQGGQSEF